MASAAFASRTPAVNEITPHARGAIHQCRPSKRPRCPRVCWSSSGALLCIATFAIISSRSEVISRGTPDQLARVPDRPRTSRISGPAHHRISAENAYFYRNNTNSIIAVTQEVTQTRWRPLCLEFRTERTKFHVPHHGAPDEPCPQVPLRDLLLCFGLRRLL